METFSIFPIYVAANHSATPEIWSNMEKGADGAKYEEKQTPCLSFPLFRTHWRTLVCKRASYPSLMTNVSFILQNECFYIWYWKSFVWLMRLFLCSSFHPVIKSYSTCIFWAERINKKIFCVRLRLMHALWRARWPRATNSWPFKTPDPDLIWP